MVYVMVQFYSPGLHVSAVVDWLLEGLLVLSAIPNDTSGQVEQRLVNGPQDPVQGTDGEGNQTGIQNETCLKMSGVECCVQIHPRSDGLTLSVCPFDWG